ncbi:MAG: Rieske 2Fe-2S domain-containing protein, partial [Pseudomonadota bacterium]
AGVDNELLGQGLTSVGEVVSGKTRPVTVGEHKLLVCHSGEDFYVVENQCSHAQARLTGGKLRGHKIFCPLHSAPFDLRDGSPLGAPATEPICAYATTVEDGKVFAILPD